MSGIVVTKSSPVAVVPPPPERGGDTVILSSSFDKIVPPFAVTSLLVFDRPIHEPAETIKSALSRALAHYRPIAGRLSTGADGEACLACTDEGVTFVAASASCTLEELSSTALLREFAVGYPGDLCRDVDPLLLVQVTEFACGGFVLAATWNHVVADGSGMGQFLRAVGEVARGVSPPSVAAPVRRWDDSLPGLSPSTVAAQRSTMDHAPRDLAYLDLTVPAGLVGRVKAESGGTAFEAAAAVLWRCRTRAALLSSGDGDTDSPAPLAFPCNMRRHVGAADGYYGNCVTVNIVPATRGAVAGSGLGDLVQLIRRAKDKAPDLLLSSSGGGEGAAEGQPQQGPQVGWYDAVAVVSWRNLGFDAADMGGGTPARVMWYDERNVVPGCVVCPPCRGGEDAGVRVSSQFLQPEHVDAFLAELARLAVPP